MSKREIKKRSTSRASSPVEEETTPNGSPVTIKRTTVIQDSLANGLTHDSTETLNTESTQILSTFKDYELFRKEAAQEDKLFHNIYTVPASKMPSWYVDNEYIFKGYRRITNSYAGCVLSLFYIHNETGNIYTHGVGVLGFISAMIAFYSILADKSSEWGDYVAMGMESKMAHIIGAFFFGAIVCLGLSTTFHLCCCHSRHVSLMWNKADYMGIVFLIIGSFVPAVYYGFHCNPLLQKLYLSMIVIFGVATICISISSRFSTPQYRYLRAGLFTSMGLTGIAPLVNSIFLYGFSLARHAFAADRIVIMGVMYVIGAILYASRVPERWFPGFFDIWGHSHQIFHCLVLAGATIHYSGILLMQNWWQQNNLDCHMSVQDMKDFWAR